LPPYALGSAPMLPPHSKKSWRRPYLGVFSPVCFELSVVVQVIAWKDSSLK